MAAIVSELILQALLHQTHHILEGLLVFLVNIHQTPMGIKHHDGLVLFLEFIRINLAEDIIKVGFLLHQIEHLVKPYPLKSLIHIFGGGVYGCPAAVLIQHELGYLSQKTKVCAVQESGFGQVYGNLFHMVGMSNEVVQECVKMAAGCIFEHTGEFEVDIAAIFCKIIVSHLNSLLPDKHECYIIWQAAVFPDFKILYKLFKRIPVRCKL